jgi:hypothetical protein
MSSGRIQADGFPFITIERHGDDLALVLITKLVAESIAQINGCMHPLQARQQYGFMGWF